MLECQAMIESQAQQCDIKLTFLPFDNIWFVYADRTGGKQVLINLLSNAMSLDKETGLKVEFFRYLIKPIKVNEFMESLDLALEFSGQQVGQSK